MIVLPLFDPPNARRIYKAPPILERFIVLECEQSQAEFSQGLLSWSEMAKSYFPNEDHQTRWELQVEEVDGVPVAESAEAVAKITYVFTRGQFPACNLITRPGILRIGILRTMEDPLTYDKFRPLAGEWAGRWMEHFGVNPKTIAMRYINMLSPALTPQLFVGGEMRVDQVLTAFGSVPGNFEEIIPPFRCEANTVISKNEFWRFEGRLKIHAVQFSEMPAIAVEIQTALKASTSSVDCNLLDALDLCHKAVNHQFECVFTPSAKQTFSPVDP